MITPANKPLINTDASCPDISACARTAVQYTVPHNATIATAAGWSTWYAYRFTLTYGPQILAKYHAQGVQGVAAWLFGQETHEETGFFNSLGHGIGFVTAPLTVPEATQSLAHYVSAATFIVTTVMLNVIAQVFFSAPSQDQERPLPMAKKPIIHLRLPLPAITQKQTLSVKTKTEASQPNAAAAAAKPGHDTLPPQPWIAAEKTHATDLKKENYQSVADIDILGRGMCSFWQSCC